jgi:hypothetical protein
MTYWTALALLLAMQGSASHAPIDSDAIDPALRKHLVEPPHITCISQDYKANFDNARYSNHCPDPYHLTIVFGNIDEVKQLDLAPGQNKSSNLNIIDYKNRNGSNWYICPKGYSAVDARGQYFKRIITIYLCREIGS